MFFDSIHIFDCHLSGVMILMTQVQWDNKVLGFDCVMYVKVVEARLNCMLMLLY